MTNAVVPPASRNSACPCGSGRRYKECHGALHAPALTADPVSVRRQAALAAALAAQKAGHNVAAEAGYRKVLAEVPDHFDALHMLGVVMLQAHSIDEAEALIALAISLRPGPAAAAAQSNLAIVHQVRDAVAAEVSLCRTVLPRLAALCVDPAPELLADLGPGDRAHILFGGMDSDVPLAQRIAAVAATHGSDVSCCKAGESGPIGWPLIDETGLGVLTDATVVVVGLEAPLGEWPLTASLRSITLVATHDAPCLLLDRIREASGQGRRRVALATSDADVADAASLPMRYLALAGDA